MGESYTAPNPMVGAVLVYANRIIGEGYHERYGEAHAEVNCLNSVKEDDRPFIGDATLYVSLEPCSHYGKTPPCADLIMRHKIPRVVISVRDNSELVNGSGILRLQQNGVEVITGVLEKEGRELIRQFLYFNRCKRPYITLKFAQSADGFIGTEGKRTNISNEISKRYVHKLRMQYQAILVGKKTVLADNPVLTVRYWNGKNPVRIILGDRHSIDPSCNVMKGGETLFCSGTIEEILQQLAEQSIISVLVEGGANTIQQFLDAGAWNEMHVITSRDRLHNGITAPGLAIVPDDSCMLEDNTVYIYKNRDA
jgi:diaminohydroxyphosphoribosylaminopyrimidine deaminase/5-amino-6-(5-phosphoribosylamino)uracil reductase